MIEVITAYPLRREKPSYVTVNMRTSFTLHPEAGEQKSLLTGSVAERPISLIERPLNENYVANREAFRRAGLGVVPTLRITPENTMLLTDVKDDGSEVYGKNLLFVLQQDLPRERPRPDIDASFLRLMKKRHFKRIKKEAMNYAQRASDHHILLPQRDALELVVNPDGSWGFMTLDLNQAKINIPAVDPLRRGETQEYNISRVETSLSILQTIPGALRGEKIVF